MKSGRIEQSSHNETWDFFAKAGSNWVAWVQSILLKDEFLEYSRQLLTLEENSKS